jgi:glycosyltransferase involved in cell wall biosynthesis
MYFCAKFAKLFKIIYQNKNKNFFIFYLLNYMKKSHTKSESKPSISIIIANYNSASTLEKSLHSVIHQTYPYKELIVMDGGSSDSSVDIIKKNENKINYWESQPDKGITHAWNKAITKATGDWIYFLGADDYLWENDTLENISEFINKVSQDAKIIYGKVVKLFNDGEVRDISGEPWEKVRQKFFYRMCLHHQGVFHHKSLFEKYGTFDESYTIAADYEMLLRYLKQYNAIFVEEIIAGALVGGISTNSNKRIIALNEFTKAAKKHNIKGFMIPRSVSYIRAFIRIFISRIISQSISDKLANFIRKLNS